MYCIFIFLKRNWQNISPLGFESWWVPNVSSHIPSRSFTSCSFLASSNFFSSSSWRKTIKVSWKRKMYLFVSEDRNRWMEHRRVIINLVFITVRSIRSWSFENQPFASCSCFKNKWEQKFQVKTMFFSLSSTNLLTLIIIKKLYSSLTVHSAAIWN